MKALYAALPALRPALAGLAMAALAMLATLTIGAGLLIDAARARGETAGRRVTVSVMATDPTEQAARTATILTMMRGRSDLGDVQPIPEAQVRRDVGEGPLPALVDAILSPGADEAGLAHALAGLSGVTVTRATPVPAPGGRALARILSALAIMSGAAVGAGFALTIETKTLALFEQLGAGDAQIVRAVGERSLAPLAIGSAAGTALAIPFIAWQAHLADGAGMRAIPFSGWATMLLAAALLIGVGVAGAAAITALRLRRRP